MSRTVVFLGTGASKALDLPLTNEIFPRLLERLMPSRRPGRRCSVMIRKLGRVFGVASPRSCLA
jgi:hypothetical protein